MTIGTAQSEDAPSRPNDNQKKAIMGRKMHILAPLTPLYFSVQLDDGQTSEADTRERAEEKFERLIKQYPDRKIELCQVWISTVRTYTPRRA